MEEDRTAEFVVVDTVSQLRSVSEQVQNDLALLHHQLATMRSKTDQMEQTVEAVESSFRLAASAILMVGPLMLAYVLDYKSRELYMSDMTALAPLITALICVSVCIGVPVFAAAFLEHTTYLSLRDNPQKPELYNASHLLPVSEDEEEDIKETGDEPPAVPSDEEEDTEEKIKQE